MSIQIETFSVYPLGCNCSIVYSEITKEAYLIDPGGNEKEIIQKLKKQDLKLKAIIHTHAHFDHCLGTKSISVEFPNASVCLHKDDLKLYNMLSVQCRFFGVPYIDEEPQAITHFLEDTEELFLHEKKFQVLHTPGHTPGSVCFYLELEEKPILFSGDTLFAGSIGRTDLWGGDFNTIMKSIKQKLLTLDDDTIVIPGHGEFTKIYNEKKYNPFL